MKRSHHLLTCISLLSFIFCTGTTMHNSPSSKSTSAWISFAQQTVPQSGKLSTHDTMGTPVILKWTIYNPTTPEFTQALRGTSEIFIQTYTYQEVEFARKRPEAVPTEMFLKGAAPLFENGLGKVDWHKVEEHVRTTMEQFFTTNDFAQWASPHDLALFVIAKDNTEGKPFGAIQFTITPDYEYGTVRIGLTGILSSAQDRGVEKLLMSSIFKILPSVTRLFLHNRPTNEKALAFYKKWGFKPLAGTKADWPDFEYVTESSNVLQKAATTCDEIK
jgi:GNAT superfamily N-acetyltransferase